MEEQAKETVLVFGAHSDDQIFGPGGTVAKYAKEGKIIKTYIFSYGEMTHPWLQRRVAVETRVREAQAADRVIGGSGVVFFGFKEGRFAKDFEEKKFKAKLRAILQKENPSKIFTHSGGDPHPDHQQVNRLLMETLKRTGCQCEVYAYDIWTPLNLKDRDLPKLVVDITDTFKIKIKALRCFKSQWVSMVSLLWSVYYKALKLGLQNKVKYAEVFWKIK